MPNWTLKEFAEHPKHDALMGVNKNIQSNASTLPKKVSAPADPAPEHCFQFVVPGTPVSKPRMTQRDRWQKRPRVLVYREYCDRTRAAAPPELSARDCYALYIVAHLAVKPSWSRKKQAAAIGQPCRAKPDADNLIKAVGDALFKDDSGLWDVCCRKYWCAAQDARTVIRVWFNP